jgi:hypothetical protein
MHRIVFLTVIFLLVAFSPAGWAGLTPKMEKQLEQLDSGEDVGKVISQDMLDFKKSLPEEGIGRFQGIKLSNNAVLFVDTKEGYIWLWFAKGETFALIYEGQLFPGAKMGDLIDSYRMK